MVGDQGLELGDEAGVPAKSDLGLDPFLERVETELLESRDLGLSEAIEGEVRKRPAAPERERLAQRHSRVGWTRVPRSARERLELVQVELALFDTEQVAGATCRQPTGAEQLAQL